MVTSRDVARAAGVSQATVSRVLNGASYISEDVRARVLEALATTGYVANAQAKAMRTSRSGAIGLVTSDIRNPYFPLLLDELTRAANEVGVRAIVWDDRAGDGHYPIDGLASGAVDGLILTSARTDSQDVSQLIRRKAPFVLCNRAPEDIPADVVMADHEAMAYTMASHIASAGRTEIAAVFGPRESTATPYRRRGFTRAMGEAGIRVRDDLIREGPTAYETGYVAARQLLEGGYGVDTIYCASDILAFGALDAARALGMSVPSDVWVTGIDGLPMAEWRAFDLTTVEQNIPEIAQRAVARLMARIAGDTQPPVRDIVPAELVVRGSTGPATV